MDQLSGVSSGTTEFGISRQLLGIVAISVCAFDFLITITIYMYISLELVEINR